MKDAGKRMFFGWKDIGGYDLGLIPDSSAWIAG